MENKIRALLLTLIMAPTVCFQAVGAIVSIAAFNFDDGFQGWEPQQGTAVSWEIASPAKFGEDKSFSNIDPSDVASLYMTVPSIKDYRAKSTVTSPEIFIDKDATLSFYVGFSSIYEFACELRLLVSTDNFATSTIAWTSSGTPSESTGWYWHPVSVPLTAYAGKDARFRFLYTSGYSDTADRGGYLGDFAIDNFFITKTIEETPGPDTPGPDVPDIPDEPEDKKPHARIVYPADYVTVSDGMPLLPPGVPMQFGNGSTGNPTLSTWRFTGLTPETLQESVIRETNPTVSFFAEGRNAVSLIVQNDYGTDMAEGRVDVAYEGDVWNSSAAIAATPIELAGSGVFPGSNSIGITAYAERFHAPPTLTAISGATIHLSALKLADRMDMLTSVGLHLYSDHDGTPGVQLASAYIMAGDLPEVEGNDNTPVYFGFEQPVFVEDGFFIVADGIPASNPATRVALATGMAETAGKVLVRHGGEWVSPERIISGVDDYLSFLFSPRMVYSVFRPEGNLPDTYSVNEEAGNVALPVFSTLPLSHAETDCEWLSFTSTSEGYRHTVTIKYKTLPAGVSAREGSVTFGDGYHSLTAGVRQVVSAGVKAIDEAQEVTVYSVGGTEVYSGALPLPPVLPHGVYILHQTGHQPIKIIR